MYLLKALVFILLPLATSAAKNPAADKFQQFHTKALASGPLKLDDAAYDRLTAPPRNYSVAVLLTALEARFGCQLCREFQPEWDLLSKSWTRGDKKGESRLLYGTLDFSDGRNTFQSVSHWHCLSVTILVPNLTAAWSSNRSSPPFLPTYYRSTCYRK